MAEGKKSTGRHVTWHEDLWEVEDGGRQEGDRPEEEGEDDEDVILVGTVVATKPTKPATKTPQRIQDRDKITHHRGDDGRKGRTQARDTVSAKERDKKHGRHREEKKRSRHDDKGGRHRRDKKRDRHEHEDEDEDDDDEEEDGDDDVRTDGRRPLTPFERSMGLFNNGKVSTYPPEHKQINPHVAQHITTPQYGFQAAGGKPVS